MAEIIELTGLNEMTIPVKADMIYKISYETTKAVDIKNDTEDSIYINSTGEFTEDAVTGVGNYMLLAESDIYNGYRPEITIGMEFYIKTTSAGFVGVVVKGY
ncbi:MAG: hypothetical protein ACI4EA_08455 [Candidatus Ornithomonoglobus sp.]